MSNDVFKQNPIKHFLKSLGEICSIHYFCVGLRVRQLTLISMTHVLGAVTRVMLIQL